MTTAQVLHAIESQRTPLSLPRMPQRPEDTGLDSSLMLELLAKILLLRGQMRLPEIQAHAKLPVGVLEPILTFMRTERLCEMSRRGGTEGAMAYTLTELGRARAQDFLARSLYSGPAPVSLKAYVEQVQKQSLRNMDISRVRLHNVFSGIVIKEHLMDQFGAGVASRRAIFIYGPPGSGKTFIAERLIGLASGDVAIPYAIAVDSEIIQVFDALVHEPVPQEQISRSGLDLGQRTDARWVTCHRPAVLVGAELTLAMLDLQFDDKARFYQAPPHVKANNGLLIIDDLGRQLVSPRDLMNRWIVPMDRRVDYLALHTGKKFVVPFDMVLVFSSNLPPSQLADPAFLRRIGYKIFVGPLEETEYRRLFVNVCAELGIEFSDKQYRYLLSQYHEPSQTPLLACLPRDILSQVCDFARFNGVKPELSAPLLDWAWNNYFVHQ
jgi:DNA-binding PadR family transcriptional regulator